MADSSSGEKQEKVLQNKLNTCGPELYQLIDPNELFLASAVKHGALSTHARSVVMAASPDTAKVDRLFEHLRRNIVERYDGLVKALAETGQNGALRVLRETSVLRPESHPEEPPCQERLDISVVPEPRFSRRTHRLLHFNLHNVSDISWFSDGTLLVGSSEKDKSLTQIHFASDFSKIRNKEILHGTYPVCRVSAGSNGSWAFCTDMAKLYVNIDGCMSHWKTRDSELEVIGVSLLSDRVIVCSKTHMFVHDINGEQLFSKEITSDVIQFVSYRPDNHMVFTIGQPGTVPTLSTVRVNDQSKVDSVTKFGETDFLVLGGVTCDESFNMFVIDHGASRVHVFDKGLQYVVELDFEEPGDLGKLWALSLLQRPKGSPILAVTDGVNGNIVLYELTY